jgi:hypothetical protein
VGGVVPPRQPAKRERARKRTAEARMVPAMPLAGSSPLAAAFPKAALR